MTDAGFSCSFGCALLASIGGKLLRLFFFRRKLRLVCLPFPILFFVRHWIGLCICGEWIADSNE
jgi:hypothetical protein